MKTNGKAAILLRIIALFFCTGPVMSAILLYFPLWKEKGGDAVLSGFSLLLILASLLPLVKLFKRMLRSPSVYMMWLIAFLIFFLFSKIADQMTVISFVGFAGNFIGSIFFRLARKSEGKATEESENEG